MVISTRVLFWLLTLGVPDLAAPSSICVSLRCMRLGHVSVCSRGFVVAGALSCEKCCALCCRGCVHESQYITLWSHRSLQYITLSVSSFRKIIYLYYWQLAGISRPAAVGFPVEKIRQEKKNTTGVVFSGSDFREKYDQKIRPVVFLKS